MAHSIGNSNLVIMDEVQSNKRAKHENSSKEQWREQISKANISGETKRKISEKLDGGSNELLGLFLETVGQLETKLADAETKREDAETKLENEKNAYELSRKTTILMTYFTSEKRFRQPPIQVNSNVGPSISGHKRSISYFDKEKNKLIKTELKIPEATIKDLDKRLYLDPSLLGIPFKASNGTAYLQSALGVRANDCGNKLEYQNEFGVQHYCLLMVQDALACLGLGTKVVYHTEISIYMMKPDVMVVLRRNGKIIFVVEVKAPDRKNAGHSGESVFSSENTGGQIWSYLLVMRNLGIEEPLGAVMTYNRIALATLDGFGSKEEKHKEILSKVQATLNGSAAPIREMHRNKLNCSKQKSSPVQKPKSVASKVKDADDTRNDAYSPEKRVDRTVFYSKVFEDGNVFPVLLQALEIAYQKAEKCALSAQEVPLVSHCEDLGCRMFCKVGKNYFDWVQSPSHVKRPKKKEKKRFRADLFNFPDKQSTQFYILGELGVGNTASVHLACNSSGRICALKFYFIHPSQKATDEARTAEELESVCAMRKIANQEAKMWIDLYDNRFPGVGTIDLGGNPCLVMPYGLSIQTDRQELIPHIRKVLKNFAEKGYHYRGSDLRWRHVLLQPSLMPSFESAVFLCDLGSLEKHNQKVEALEAVVNAQLLMLESKIKSSSISD